LYSREWKVVAGAVAAASIQLAAAWMLSRRRGHAYYFRALMHLREVLPLLEPRLYQTHSLRSFCSLLLPWPRVAFALYALCALAFLSWQFILAARRRCQFAFGAAACLRSWCPTLDIYDLVILAPAFLLLGDWAWRIANSRSRCIQQLLYLCYLLFLAGPLARITHLQLSVAAEQRCCGSVGGFLIAPSHPERNLFIRLRMSAVERPYDLLNTVGMRGFRCRLDKSSSLHFVERRGLRLRICSVRSSHALRMTRQREGQGFGNRLAHSFHCGSRPRRFLPVAVFSQPGAPHTCSSSRTSSTAS
jgi:hypothetical protein